MKFTDELKYPCNAHGNIHAEKSIHLKILEWTSIVHGCSINTWISICIFVNEKFGMDIAWTLQPGSEIPIPKPST